MVQAVTQNKVQNKGRKARDRGVLHSGRMRKILGPTLALENKGRKKF